MSPNSLVATLESPVSGTPSVEIVRAMSANISGSKLLLSGPLKANRNLGIYRSPELYQVEHMVSGESWGKP